MRRTQHTTEPIKEKLRHPEIDSGHGQKVPKVCKTVNQLDTDHRVYTP